jgi:hypothetical protein
MRQDRRWATRLLILASVTACIACASESQAIKLTESVSATSDTAIAAIQALGEADEAKTEGFVETRARLADLIVRQAKVFHDSTRVHLDRARHEALAEVSSAGLEAMQALASFRQKAWKDFEAVLEKERQTPRATLESLKKVWDERRARANEAPQDFDREEAALKAEGRYFVFAAKYFNQEVLLVAEARTELDLAYSKAVDSIRDLVQKRTEALEKVYSASLAKLDLRERRPPSRTTSRLPP